MVGIPVDNVTARHKYPTPHRVASDRFRIAPYLHFSFIGGKAFE